MDKLKYYIFAPLYHLFTILYWLTVWPSIIMGVFAKVCEVVSGLDLVHQERERRKLTILYGGSDEESWFKSGDLNGGN